MPAVFFGSCKKVKYVNTNMRYQLRKQTAMGGSVANQPNFAPGLLIKIPIRRRFSNAAVVGWELDMPADRGVNN